MTKKKQGKTHTFPCQQVKQGEHTIYLFAASAKTLWNILKINRKEENKEEGYQRVLSPSRATKIARYIDSGNPLPMSVLISLDDATVSKDGKTITIPDSQDAGWVIDGQHRLAGAHKAKSDITVPVVAFVALGEKEQIKQFITINREAKGVPTSLYYDLLRQVPEKRSHAEIAKEKAADIANDLKRDENSPFFGKIVTTTAPKKGQISTVNFVRKVSPLILQGKGILATYTQQEQKRIIENYFTALRTVFPKMHNEDVSVFYQTLGFGALLNALPPFFSICLREHKGFRVEDAVGVFEKIKHFDFGAWKKMGTGSVAEIQAGDDLRDELESAFADNSNQGGSLLL